MRMYDIIKKKRDGFALSKEEIEFFIMGYTEGTIPDYQASALLMAIYFKGMTDIETLNLTLAVTNSGEKMNLSEIEGFKVDKHSSGGVGDKTTLVVAPLVAACGVKVAKMSGRGLGHTGGTIDKLEAIEGFKTTISPEEFIKIVKSIGLSIIGQSGELAPADKKLYALRDVTSTVDSIPLIASSIMGKKLASADDGIVLDVKVGSGSFNKTVQQAEALAKLMVSIGKGAGKKTIAVISDMNRPLGRTVGNALEVKEAIETLSGRGDERFLSLCLTLSAEMLKVAGIEEERAKKLVYEKLYDKSALKKFSEMVSAQGGNTAYIDNPTLLATGKTYEVISEKEGYITKIDTEKYGIASLELGAGRNRKEDRIDMSAGIEVVKNLGDSVRKGEILAVLHASDESRFLGAEKTLLEALTFGDEPCEDSPIVYEIVR